MKRKKSSNVKTAKLRKVFKSFLWPVKEDVEQVCLAGDFNGWVPMPMEKMDDGFQTIVDLSPGEYQYKFIVDGEWVEDPAAEKMMPNEFGTVNCVLCVK
jgi:1,4-alpha-glucan branching enzyme